METLVWSVTVIAALAVGVAIASWFATNRNELWERINGRFIMGVPWGSLLVICGVLTVYVFVQDGLTDWKNPVIYPFVNWSYLYPTGLFLSSFSHAGPAHLIANLSTALVLAPLAEYIWGHYPEDDPLRVERASYHQPWVRALVIFPGAIVSLGIVSSLFAWGPVIGFSGIVFAFAGFAVIKYPLGTVIAIVGRTALRVIGDAITSPVVTVEVSPRLSPPGWVGVSFQGHGFGFLMGAILAVLLIRHRRQMRPPSPVRLFVGLTLVMMSTALWAIWSSAGQQTYVLYQGLGVILSLLLAAVLVLATVVSDRSLLGPVTRRHAVIMCLVIPVILISLVAIPLNLLTVVEHDPPEEALTIEDYDMYYAQEVSNGIGPAIDLPGANEIGGGTTNGVILVSEDRHFWSRVVSSNDLAFDGESSVVLGGVGWREDVDIYRDGWDPVGNDSVYQVEFEHDGDRSTTFTSENATVDTRIDAHSFSIKVTPDGFAVGVMRPDGSIEMLEIPEEGERVGGDTITIEHRDEKLFAEHAESRALIAERE